AQGSGPGLHLSLAGIGAYIGRLLHGRPKPPPPQVQYVLGPAYQAGGVWYYPQESFSFDRTGIAAIEGAGHAPLTADDERYDPSALAGAVQTLQLPAIAEVTNLENGRQVELRLNDRGPPSPARLIAVTPRAAELLAFDPDGTARVRVRVEPGPSHALAEALHAEPLAVAAAPVGAVQASALPPLAGARQAELRPLPSGPAPAEQQAATVPSVPLRLPERVVQTVPAPGTLWIEAGSFSRAEFAARRRAQLADTGAQMERAIIDGQPTYSVRIGPYASVAEADGALDRVVRDGVTDARIVVR
ncbi:MAG: SPOR domain-containing protein, partial [Acidisphaera sp.]|nr:SPOR domain-containing protein [Acidisphaera sp.]